jgi:hypothetical protein
MTWLIEPRDLAWKGRGIAALMLICRVWSCVLPVFMSLWWALSVRSQGQTASCNINICLSYNNMCFKAAGNARTATVGSSSGDRLDIS